jgi:hypothetical protein
MHKYVSISILRYCNKNVAKGEGGRLLLLRRRFAKDL